MSNSNLTLMPCEYFPCLEWYRNFSKAENDIVIETGEHFERASLRNRCYVAGANGLVALSIPLAGGRNQKMCMKDVKVSYDANWRALHWKTIASCYRRAPYFDYFEHELQQFFRQQHTFLIDWNMASLALCQQILQSKKTFSISHQFFELEKDANCLDLRQAWDAHNFQEKLLDFTYWQTFQDRIGFQPNLSTLDLIFCEGKSGIALLMDI